ncbi:MAG: lauroyl/myristoyl acyltransferase [Candidatus Omnitrophota bacterium]|jgi:lauroyl/myristoyl acyltransferase
MVRFLIIVISKLRVCLDGLRFNFVEIPFRKKIISEFVSENEFKCKEGLAHLIKRNVHYLKKLKLQNLMFTFALFFDNKEMFEEHLSHVNLKSLNKFEKYRGSGCVVISYHVGPYSLLPLILISHGYNVTLMLRPNELTKGAKFGFKQIKNKLEIFFSKNEELGKLTLVDSSSIMALLQVQKAIKRGDVVVIFPDTAKDASVQSIPVPFFQQNIAGHGGLAQLFKITKAPFVPIYLTWEKEKASISVCDPLDLNEKDSDETITNNIYKLFPELVKKYPEQWMQFISYHLLKY